MPRKRDSRIELLRLVHTTSPDSKHVLVPFDLAFQRNTLFLLTISSTHALYRSGLISVKKLSAGIQLDPPQNTRTPLTSKRKVVPSASWRGSWTTTA